MQLTDKLITKAVFVFDSEPTQDIRYKRVGVVQDTRYMIQVQVQVQLQVQAQAQAKSKVKQRTAN